MKTIFIWLVISIVGILNGDTVFSGDLKCYGYTSTTSYFQCGAYGNCTWWAAFMRPDLASAGISGDARYWYNNAGELGFNLGMGNIDLNSNISARLSSERRFFYPL
ncbi:MAG: hypothetical protein V3574_04935 [Candidatus Moraniibacteriota bacterium]